MYTLVNKNNFYGFSICLEATTNSLSSISVPILKKIGESHFIFAKIFVELTWNAPIDERVRSRKLAGLLAATGE